MARDEKNKNKNLKKAALGLVCFGFFVGYF